MKKYISMAAVLLALAGLNEKASAQPLQINFFNSSTYSSDNVWLTFLTAYDQGGTTQTGNNPGIAGTFANGGGTLDMLWSGNNTVSGTLYNNGGLAYSSVSYTLNQIMNPGTGPGTGVQVDYMYSGRIFVSLGNPMAVTGTNGIFNFGTPSPNNPSDPNFGTRWDIIEIARDGNPADQGDLSAINAYGIPMQLQTYGTNVNGGASTQLQTRYTTVNAPALSAALINLANSNTANNPAPYNAGASGTLQNNYVAVMNNNGGTVRIVSPDEGAAAAASSTVGVSGTIYSPNTASGNATIGSGPTFGDYVQHVHSNGVLTNISGQYANNGTGAAGGTWTFTGVADAVALGTLGTSSQLNITNGTVSATWTNASGATVSGVAAVDTTAAAIRWSGGIANAAGNSLGIATVYIPPDSNVGGTNANYLQSASIYHAAWDNYGVIFQWTPVTGTVSGTTTFGPTQTYLNYNDFISAANGTAASDNLGNVFSQVAHDLFAGYNYGLVGSTVADVTNGGTSYNDIGSEGWTAWENLIKSGTYTGSLPLLYDQLQPGGTYYNQWAKLVYEYGGGTEASYGFPYSDYLEDPLIQTAEYLNGSGTYDVNILNITILPDSFVIPEPSTIALLLLGGGAFLLFRRLRIAKPE